MTTHTTHGYPYPNPDDAVAGYPAVGQELAQKLDDGPIDTDGDIYARRGATAQVMIGDIGGPGIAFGASTGNYFYGSTGGIYTDARLRIKGLMTARHAYANDRHFEAGSLACGPVATNVKKAMSLAFTDPFYNSPTMALGAVNETDYAGGNTPGPAPAYVWAIFGGPAGCTMYISNASNSNPSVLWICYVVEGPD